MGTDAGGSRLSRDTHQPHFWMLMVVLGGPWLSTSWIPAAWMKMGDRGPMLPAFLTDGNLELCQLPRGLPLKQSCYTWDFGAFNLRRRHIHSIIQKDLKTVLLWIKARMSWDLKNQG